MYQRNKHGSSLEQIYRMVTLLEAGPDDPWLSYPTIYVLAFPDHIFWMLLKMSPSWLRRPFGYATLDLMADEID